MESVGSYLDRQDQLACSLVCKAFRDEFYRFLWHQLAFKHTMTPPPVFEMDSEQQKSIRYNMQWTRKLTIDTECRRKMIPFLSESCFLLNDLNVFVSRTPLGDPTELFMAVINLIANNTQLRSCDIIRFADLSCNSLGMMAGALSRSPCLTNLILEFRVSPPPRGWFQCVLQNLPKPLEKLELTWRRLRNSDVPVVFPVQEWPESYPNLATAKLMVELVDGEEHTLFQFFERCPALIECSVPKMPSIQALNELIVSFGSKRFPFHLTKLDYRIWSTLDESQWNHLLWVMKPHIRSISTATNFKLLHNHRLVREMTMAWSQTLEEIHIYNSHLIKSEDLQLILTTCPKLKKLESICYWMPLARQQPVPGFKAFASEEDRPDRGMPDWACVELEELKLSFADARGDTPETMIANQEERTIQGVDRVYQQLGRLTKLKKLTIGWASLYPMGGNLDMSLSSGLGHMKDLESLMMLDIYYIDKVEVGLPEVQWMLDNWPSLRTISGLRCRYPLVGMNAEEPDFVQLLQSKRSWLTIE